MPLSFGKNLFAPRTEPLASYDAFDIAQAIGYITFYGGNVKTISGGSLYRLSTIQFRSHDIDTDPGAFKASSGEYDFNISGAFTVQFHRSINIGGKTIINIPLGPTASGTATNKPNGIAVISVWKVDEDGNQTNLYPRTSGGVVTGSLGSSGFADSFSAIPINLPVTHFKDTDTLRLDVETWSASAGGDGAACWLGHDPQNRTASGGNYTNRWSNNGSQLIFQVPVKIDI